jgi:hypothetical protein
MDDTLLIAIAQQLRAIDPLHELVDAAAAALLSTPTLTGRPERITYTTLGNVWGADAAITFTGKLLALTKSAVAADAATATYVHSVLTGQGADAGNAETKKIGQWLIAKAVATADQVQGVLFLTTYRLGVPEVTADQVAHARRLIDAEDAKEQLLAKIEAARAAMVAQLDAYHREVLDGDELAVPPTVAELLGEASAAMGA